MDFRKKKVLVLLLAVIFLGLGLQLPFQTLRNMPLHQHVSVGDSIDYDINLPEFLTNQFEFNIDGVKPSCFHLGQTTPVAAKLGDLKVEVRLFGIIPVRQMMVSVVPEIRVIPGGQAIGVMVDSEGVMVVGRSAIIDEKGERHNPAAEAGVELGDTLIKINGQKVETESQVRALIDKMGQLKKPLSMEFKRKNTKEHYHTKISPIYCNETQRYRVGLFVRDSTAGVGTMTFYHPESRSYGALGHIITDIDTCQPINLNSGKVVGARIEGIRMGKKGQPGEKLGVFRAEEQISGNITKNTNCGIFGKLDKDPKNLYSKTAIPVAMASDIKEGPAEIYTVLKDNKIEKFSIEIQEIIPNGKDEGKGMIIKINDSKLLAKTGGIIQGMSGSPIIQDGKLVGAVTHVFVNDPSRGYGVLAEWMLYTANVLPKHVSKRKNEQFDVRTNVAC
ncbi:SpoIVB peptidase, Serine peptidase, MEROPS family S55 [Desulforamulus reducens MI-1]|uniref:SpoIVB peptidase, Serine peptidase, MEROPS family S55 n=1 Tax=Desulforamulus reducens (strain ATCC BAA-1160 / DSM 100696 / MI-1) TaxID=349161 RepID=A4J3G7_DESRM|nr:SpoIVB peptidase [Desulforamulus reducens]ABO49620.1 SpoIVB peptidase, Serine peptidase, MEROPS family S55 [Desulforamulus reducens MI-1]